MITEHHIDLIQVSNSLDLKMTTRPRWGPRVKYYYEIANEYPVTFFNK